MLIIHAKKFLFCFNKSMTFQILAKQPIKFFEKKGVKFFEPFNAVDKNKRPVKLYFPEGQGTTVIFADNYEKKLSRYDLSFSPEKREMKGEALATEPQKEGIGEVLNLAALIEFHKNGLNRFKLFSLEDCVQYYTRYGFKIVTDDVDYILRVLKSIIKAKSVPRESLRFDAKFFYPQLEGTAPMNKSLPETLYWSCNVMSNHLKELSRRGLKYDHAQLDDSYMMFTDYEFLTEKDYLNSLFDEHEINYKV